MTRGRSEGPIAPRLTPRVVVWCLTLAWASLIVWWALAMPVYQGPDEPQQVDLVLAASKGRPYPAFDQAFMSSEVLRSKALVFLRRGDWHLPVEARLITAQVDLNEPLWFGLRADEAPPRDRPSFDELAEPVVQPTTSDLQEWPYWYRNYIAQHPPLYPVVLGRLLSPMALGTMPFDQAVVWMRLFSALFMVPLPWSIYLTAQRVGVSTSAALAAAAFPLAVPQLAHVAGSVNNDTALVILGALTAYAGARIVAGDDSVRAAVLAGLCGGAALLTKGFALFIPAWLCLAYWLRGRVSGSWRTVGSRALIALSVLAVVGGWWWIRNVVVFGSVQPTLVVPPPAHPSFHPSVLWWGGRFVALFSERFWLDLGWLTQSPRLPAVLVGVAVAVSVCLVYLGLRREHDVQVKRSIRFLLVPVPFLIAFVAATSWVAYAGSNSLPGIQGRYLFAAITGIAVVVANGVVKVLAGRERVSVGSMLVAGAILNLAAFASSFRAFFGGPGASMVDRWRAFVAWSPFPSPVPELTLLALIASWTLAALVAVRWAGGDRGVDEVPAGTVLASAV